jgi:hypothetical protein
MGGTRIGPQMSYSNSLTRDTFLESLQERIESLREANVEMPEGVDSQVETVVSSSPELFENELFRDGAAHLLEGLDADMAAQPGGPEMLEERLWALPGNLQTILEIAAEHRGLTAV